MKEIDKFYHSLMQDVQARTLASEDGGTQEQMFTSMAVDSLAESGETENAEIVYYEHDLGTRNQQKINGFYSIRHRRGPLPQKQVLNRRLRV